MNVWEVQVLNRTFSIGILCRFPTVYDWLAAFESQDWVAQISKMYKFEMYFSKIFYICILLVVITYNILLETGKEKNILLKQKTYAQHIYVS